MLAIEEVDATTINGKLRMIESHIRDLMAATSESDGGPISDLLLHYLEAKTKQIGALITAIRDQTNVIASGN